MNSRDEGFLDVVYGAAVEPALWPRVLEQFADMVNADLGHLLVQNPETGDGEDLLTRTDPKDWDGYFTYFASRNVLLKTDNPRQFMRNWSPKVLTDEDWITKDVLLRSEYYNDFLKPRGIHSVLMTRIAARGMYAINLDVTRPAHKDQFGEREIELAKRYQPHLIRAYKLAQRVGPVFVQNSGMATLFDHSPYGLYFVDSSARIQHANAAGEAMLAAGTALRLARKQLQCGTRASTRLLETLIRTAASADRSARKGGSMTLPAAPGARPFAVIVSPLPEQKWLLFDNSPLALVCVTDLAATPMVPDAELCSLLGLSPAETRVALSLMEGRNTRETAAFLGISFFTVRAHLVRIFHKTGTNSQADLQRLLTRAAGATVVG